MLLSILRFMSGLLLLQHGLGKWLKFPPGAFPPTMNLNSMPGYAGIIELVGGILLVLGLFTRPAAFIVSGMCAVGYFLVHAPNGFFPILNKGETHLPLLLRLPLHRRRRRRRLEPRRLGAQEAVGRSIAPRTPCYKGPTRRP